MRKGDSKHSPKPILDDFLQPARDEGYEVHLKNLYNDYVYFWRWALWKVLEQNNGPGIVSFITASSYLAGPAFVGMRKMMRKLFDELWLIDLEGSSVGARKTENVFNIKTPVVIAVGVRYGQPQPETSATVHYSRITGSRDDKFTRLNTIDSFDALTWQECPTGWTDVFLPSLKTDYRDWPRLTDIFPWQHSGVQVKRKWPIAELPEVLLRRWEALVGLSFEERRIAFHETRDRKIARTYRDIFTNEKLTSVALLESDAQPTMPVRYGYRTFDRQWILPDNRLADFLRPSLWSQSDSQLYLTSLLTKPLGGGPAAMVSLEVPDLDFFCNRGAKDVVPLWRDKKGQHANINHALLKKLQQVAYGTELLAEDLFAYCYSILGCPSYTDLFAEQLRIPGPRVPFTKDKTSAGTAAGT